MDFLKNLLGDFDPAALVPDLEALFNNLDGALRVVVLAGPLCLLGLGLLYLLAFSFSRTAAAGMWLQTSLRSLG